MAREQKSELIGRVVSNKMNKTIVVSVERMKKHRLYGKYIRVSKKYKAHDEENAASPGDTVKIIESRPISKEKRWIMTEILEKAQ